MKTESVYFPFKSAYQTYLNPKVLPPELRCRLVKSTEGASTIFGFKLVYVFLNGSILV